jgi:hypothetical protein
MVTIPHSRGRPIQLLALPIMVLAAVLLAGCSNDGTNNASSTTSGAESSQREAAEDYLHKIDGQLDTVLADYRAGRTDQAHELAESIGHGYEGVPEETVAKASPTVQRQLDPLIEATLPGAIKRQAAESEVAGHVQRAQTLITQALEAIEKSE